MTAVLDELDERPGVRRTVEARRSAAAIYTDRRKARFEDLRILLDGGEPYDQIFTRLGVTREALERQLFRHDRRLLRRLADAAPDSERRAATRAGLAARQNGKK